MYRRQRRVPPARRGQVAAADRPESSDGRVGIGRRTRLIVPRPVCYERITTRQERGVILNQQAAEGVWRTSARLPKLSRHAPAVGSLPRTIDHDQFHLDLQRRRRRWLHSIRWLLRIADAWPGLVHPSSSIIGGLLAGWSDWPPTPWTSSASPRRFLSRAGASRNSRPSAHLAARRGCSARSCDRLDGGQSRL